MSALEASAEKEITAQELAFRLGVTKRSANRFLSTLEREEILKVAYKKENYFQRKTGECICAKRKVADDGYFFCVLVLVIHQ